ncbi:MAG TPA: hypothetical protein VHY08_10110 [Bacillota bacterium]|nr:hypothetical protein [Bacillota bacterium]
MSKTSIQAINNHTNDSTNALTKNLNLDQAVIADTPVASVLLLQRTIGNHAVERLFNSQNLTIGKPMLKSALAKGRLINRRLADSIVIQRANATDPRLPLDQAEALAYAAAAKTEIDNANLNLGTASLPANRNIPVLLTQQGITLEALTPRHDSNAPPGNLRFFAGQANYNNSLTLPEDTTYHLKNSGTTKAVRIRARNHSNIDNLLSRPEIEHRLIQAVSELSHLMATRPGTPNLFDQYQAEFNSLWNTPPFDKLMTDFDPALDSKGPRTIKSRQIFNYIYQHNSALKAAYDQNPAGAHNIREQIDAFTAPEGMNLINSPRLQALREVFFTFSVPVHISQYTAFRTAIQNAANALDTDDRIEVEQSNEWQRLINDHVRTQDQRLEIRTIISTPPPSAGSTAPVPSPVTPPSTPPGPAPAGVMTPQAFVNSITIDGPTAPVLANNRREPITLTPKSSAPNPNVNISTRFTVTPAKQVYGNNISPVSVFPNAADAGVPFEPEITNTGGTISMNAHLDLVNGPAGLTLTAPPDLPFTVQDNRLADFLANWLTDFDFNTGMFQDSYLNGGTIRYLGGTQNFNVCAFLPSGQTNPGLSLFIRVRLKRGATTIAPLTTPVLEPFPPNKSITSPIALNISAPATVPISGDPLNFEIELIDSDRKTVLDTQVLTFKVMPETTYTQAQAIIAAVADDAFFHDTSSTGLLGQMTAQGGMVAQIASFIAPQPPVPTSLPMITLRSLIKRHDSAAFVKAVKGNYNPSFDGYFFGTTYGPPPDTANSRVKDAGGAAFSMPDVAPRFIAVNRTTDVAGGSPPRLDSEVIRLVVHESVHALDYIPRVAPNSSGWEIQSYKDEFRAYWMDGRFGQPDQAICLAPYFSAVFDPSLTPPGPKSPRAREIFKTLYGDTTYKWMKDAYDDNKDGFRTQVDNYLVPDGINLIVSQRLDMLRDAIDKYNGSGFATIKHTVQTYMGTAGPPPALVGVLDANEKEQIKHNRAWRDLVNRRFPNPTQRNIIKNELQIPL